MSERSEAFNRMAKMLRENPLNFQNYPHGEMVESEEKSMLHNVTVKHEENKVLEEVWVLRAGKAGDPFGIARVVIGERELDHKPKPDEIAQFLSDTKADFVSVVQNYRFQNELPFYGKEI